MFEDSREAYPHANCEKVRLAAAVAHGEVRRSWRDFDKAWREQMETPHEISDDVFLKFAKRFGVHRNLSESPARYAQFVDNQLSKKWPLDLEARAQTVGEIAEAAKEEGLTRALEVSLASKTIWFLQPAGWYMFDVHVANALWIRNKSDPQKRITRYMACLKGCGVERIDQKVKEWTDATEFGPPERFVDKFLMFVGKCRVGYWPDFRKRVAWAVPDEDDCRFADSIAPILEDTGLIERVKMGTFL